MNFNNTLIRCSAIHKIMTPPKDKAAKEKGELGQTAKTYLQELYLEKKYGRRQEFTSKYVEKGKMQEEIGITLFSLYQQDILGRAIPYKKNDVRLNNEYLTGEPDIYEGAEITLCEEGADIKCPWSLWTFPMFEEKNDPQYEWQNHGYIALTGAKRWTTSYTLVNAPANLIDDEKRKLYFAMQCPGEESDAYLEKCQEIERNMIFDMAQFKSDNPYYDLHCKDWRWDIPRAERVKPFVTERNDITIELIYSQVRKCRAYMNKTWGDTSNILIASHDKEVNATIVEAATPKEGALII